MTKRQNLFKGLFILSLAAGSFAAGPSIEALTIEAGSATFEAATNVPGIAVKGASSSLSGKANVSHDSSGLLIEQIRILLPVKSLATGMKVRDEHMRKYIFTTSDGQVPDVEFSADKATCNPSSAGEFTCQVTGNLTIRGQARPFSTVLSVKQQASTFRATGDGVVKLSDYGIPLPTQFGVSTTNEVKLKLSFVGRPAPAQSANNGGGH
jgi:polyisoprenoid-binding protein YceI